MAPPKAEKAPAKKTAKKVGRLGQRSHGLGRDLRTAFWLTLLPMWLAGGGEARQAQGPVEGEARGMNCGGQAACLGIA